jgi:putative membrane protein
MIIALLHPAAQVGKGFPVHPSTVIGIVALGALYLWRARAGARAGLAPAPNAAQRLGFFTALAILFFTLNGPLHDLSDTYLFSAHMIQHLVLTLVVPPLLLAGTPGWMLRPLLGPPRVRALAEWALKPTTCFAIFNLVLAAWHLPPLYNLALAHHNVHILQHLLFIAASVVMWWPLMSPLEEVPRLSYPGQMLYCFLMTLPMSIIAVYITMADRVLYPLYAIAPRVWSITPLEDQRYGGLIMWIPGGLFFYSVMTVVFVKWARRGGADDAVAAQPSAA